MSHNTTYIVISAEKSTESTYDNLHRTAELELLLESQGYPFRRAIGSYRGIQEASFLVSVTRYEDIESLRSLAAEFGQESILEIKQGHGWLLFTDGTEEYIGTTVEATGREQAYTQVGSRLFTFRKEA